MLTQQILSSQKKTPVEDTNKLTDEEKATVRDKIIEANKDNFPEGTVVEIKDDGTAIITYPDNSVDIIPGGNLVYKATVAGQIANDVVALVSTGETNYTMFGVVFTLLGAALIIKKRKAQETK